MLENASSSVSRLVCRVTGGELFEDIVAREYYSEADARYNSSSSSSCVCVCLCMSWTFFFFTRAQGQTWSCWIKKTNCTKVCRLSVWLMLSVVWQQQRCCDTSLSGCKHPLWMCDSAIVAVVSLINNPSPGNSLWPEKFFNWGQRRGVGDEENCFFPGTWTRPSPWFIWHGPRRTCLLSNFFLLKKNNNILKL